jgi:CDGSH iron-sulfur domain-containing protein 3
MAGTEKSASKVNIKTMEESKQYKSQAIVEVIEHGPLKISGNILINDMKRGIEDFQQEVWLCRCGRSQNKPYCDSSHKK